jgi:hypothetical protein
MPPRASPAQAGWSWRAWPATPWVPVIAVTASGVLFFPRWVDRKLAGDAELAAPHRRDMGGVPPPAAAAEEGFGRHSARTTGLLDGDRPFQGVFGSKKMAGKMGPQLPANRPEHPSQERHPKRIIEGAPPRARAAPPS